MRPAYDDNASIADWFAPTRGERRTRRGRTGDLCDLVDRLAEGAILDREEEEDAPNARRTAESRRWGFVTRRDKEGER